MLKSTYVLPPLPPATDLETKRILRAVSQAHRYLAEVKGRATAIPNETILISTLSLQEAKASSAIENIVTTQDELFRVDLFPNGQGSPAAKEVARYQNALNCGYKQIRKTGLLTNNTIVEMFQILKRTHGEFRTTPGTALRNEASGQIVYIPPQNGSEIIEHMTALERFINDDSLSALDPLIKLALIHHQFESIHPFPDGNGRIGRILNVLYLTRTGLLDTPILYLSRSITRTKSDYYRLLQAVRETGDWEDWILYVLQAVSDTAQATLELIEGLRLLMADFKQRMRAELPRIYSQDLLNNLFRHPYTRIEFVQKDLEVTRQTAARHLEKLADKGFLRKQSAGRNNYYVNLPLVDLFMRVSDGQ